MSISFHQREPSGLEFLSRSLGQGLGTGIQERLQFARQHQEEERQRQITAKEVGSVQERLKALGPDASPFDKYAAVAASSVSDSAKKSLVESLKFEGAKDFAQKLRGKGEEGLTEADILEGMALEYIPPGAGVELLRGKTGTRERESAQKIFTPSFQKTQEAGKAAKEGIAGVRRAKELLKSKKFGPLSFDNLVTKLGIPGAASPEAQEFQATTLGFLGGERARFGSRITDADLKLIQNKLPDISRSSEGNEAILNLRESEYLFHQFEQQAQQNVLKKNKGFTYDFPGQAEEEMENLLSQHPEVEKLYTQSAETLKKLAGETSEIETEEFTHEQLPPASHYKDKYAEDDKGNFYKSNGRSWRKV